MDVDTDLIDVYTDTNTNTDDTNGKHDTQPTADSEEAARNLNGDSDSADREREEELRKLSLWERREMIRVHIGCRVGFDSDAERTT